ncbi:MAG: penicillin-binding transpeptidase domain-containing protein [Candidatus Gottesmanbacteria bacterium]
MKLGSAFSDNVTGGPTNAKRLFRGKSESWWSGSGRFLLFTCILFFCLFILFFRLFHLTVVKGHEYRSLADGNRTRMLIRHAPRGLLFDRTGKPLVANTPQYRLIRPCEGSDIHRECTTRISQEDGDRLLQEGLPMGSFLEVDYQRVYLYEQATAHVVGYINELSQEELKDEYYELRGYGPGDRIGRVGAEEVFEERLRGKNGKELVEVDAAGKILRVLGSDPAIPGENITLSLDVGLSERARESFPEYGKGAVIVSKPTTGEILALYSSPSYVPSRFISGMSQEEYNALMNNPDKPMFNRSIGGVYPPGSVFKIVTALAGLEEGVLTKDTTVEDVGVITIGSFTFPNWFFKQYGKTDGVVNVVKAMQRSNDIFFYKAGEWIGITKIASWAHRVGLGKPLGIELSGEASGLMPDPAWKQKRFVSPEDLEARNNEWYLGDTYHIAIGQGYLMVTPLQVNTWTNVIANGGVLCRPTIKKVTTSKFQGSTCKDLDVHKETIALITEGMREACSPGGTGWPLFDFAITASPSAGKVFIPVACKTGTAEFGDPQDKTHAWFTVFAPIPETTKEDTKQTISGDPEIAITILVEGAGEGSDIAAPVAKKILEAWFMR